MEPMPNGVKFAIWNAEKCPLWDDFDFDPNCNPIQQRRMSIVTDDYVILADLYEI